MDWSKATSIQLSKRFEDGNPTTLLLPWGAIEAHGPHLPIATDCYVADGLARHIATQIEGAIVGPTIPFGYAPRTNYAGTLSVEPETLITLLSGLVTEIGAAGIERLAIIPAHAENMHLLSLIGPRLAQLGMTTFLPFLELNTFMAERNAVLTEFGIDAVDGGWHAGASETSVMLALQPELVDMSQATAGFVDSDFRDRLAATLVSGYRILSESGTMGDPTKASAELGRAIIARLSDRFLADVC